jgi:biopolymer transport protein ExbD
MSKTRIKRFQNLRIDMTAMCDVAFLLLLFFVSVSTFRSPDPLNINLPGYENHIYDPADNNFGIISIGQDKIMYEMPDEIREQTLGAMSAKYHVAFSSNKMHEFSKAQFVGAPLTSLAFYMDNNSYRQHFYDKPGIPYKGDNSELFNWILESRKAEVNISNKTLRMMIKADKDVMYPQIQQVISILQQQKVNKFSLITGIKRD